MSAEHNHAPRCCCLRIADGEVIERCSGCPEHGDLATPYTEQETTNG